MARRVVLDANIALSLFLRLPYSEHAEKLMQRLRMEEADIFIPALWEYECLTALRKAVTQGMIKPEDANQIISELLELEFERINPNLTLHRLALHWAERLGQNKAYDAQYVALAEKMASELWSADQRLVKSINLSWAHWVGEE